MAPWGGRGGQHPLRPRRPRPGRRVPTGAGRAGRFPHLVPTPASMHRGLPELRQRHTAALGPTSVGGRRQGYGVGLAHEQVGLPVGVVVFRNPGRSVGGDPSVPGRCRTGGRRPVLQSGRPRLASKWAAWPVGKRAPFPLHNTKSEVLAEWSSPVHATRALLCTSHQHLGRVSCAPQSPTLWPGVAVRGLCASHSPAEALG